MGSPMPLFLPEAALLIIWSRDYFGSARRFPACRPEEYRNWQSLRHFRAYNQHCCGVRMAFSFRSNLFLLFHQRTGARLSGDKK